PPNTGEYAGPPMIWFTWCISKRYSPLPARFAPGVRASPMSVLLQCRIHFRHHLLRHQLHRAPRELRIHPVVAGGVGRAERADLLAEREQLLDHAVHRAGDDQARRHRLGGDRRVGLVLVQLEEIAAAAEADELADELLEVEVVRTLRAVAILLRRALVVGDQDRLRHAPVLALGLLARRLTAFDVAR